MNVTNWLLIFVVSVVAIGAVGYLTNFRFRRPKGAWSVLSLALASLICATMFATLFVQSPLAVTTMQAAAAGDFTCLGTPALVRAGDPIAITGRGEVDSNITVWQEKTTLANTTIAAAGDYSLNITLTTPGVQNVLCQSESAAGQVQSVQLSFLVIGQAAALQTTPVPATNTPAPTATKTIAPTKPPTKTTAPTATSTLAPTKPPTATSTIVPTEPPPVTVEPPVVDLASIPAEILPGETFRLQGTAAGSARIRVAINDRVVGGAVSSMDGGWRTTIGFASAGTYTVTAQLVENDVVVAESAPVSVSVLEPAPTNTPEPTATNTAAPTPTNTAVSPATSTLEPTATPAAATTAEIAPSQPMSDTVAAPAALPDTGSDFSQGVPWVILLLLIGAGLTLGIGQLSKKPTA